MKENEKMANEIVAKFKERSDSYIRMFSAVNEAMKWKDEQLAKEKEQWINKACELIRTEAHDFINYTFDNPEVDVNGLAEYFKKNMADRL